MSMITNVCRHGVVGWQPPDVRGSDETAVTAHAHGRCSMRLQTAIWI